MGVEVVVAQRDIVAPARNIDESVVVVEIPQEVRGEIAVIDPYVLCSLD